MINVFDNCRKAAVKENPDLILREAKFLYINQMTQLPFLFYTGFEGESLAVSEDKYGKIRFETYERDDSRSDDDNSCYGHLNEIYKAVKEDKYLKRVSYINTDTENKMISMINDTKVMLDYSYKYDVLSEQYGELLKHHNSIRVQYWFVIFDFKLGSDNFINTDKFSYYVRYGLIDQDGECAGFYDVEFNKDFYFLDEYITEFNME